ncbi:MAG: GyrI-like domain-containing protein [Bacillus sp. (in: firmicutes)]
MPKISRIEMLKKNEQPTMYIRTRTSVEKLPQLIGECYEKLAAYLKEMDEQLSEVPYVAYYNMDMQDLDVEIGFPMAKPMPNKGEIKAGSIPAGKRIFCMYQGPYNEIESIYNEMATWIVEKGFKSEGIAYEFYYNDMEYPESQWLTKVEMPIK